MTNRTALSLLSAAALTAAAPAWAEKAWAHEEKAEQAALAPHTHGVSKLDVALEGQTLSMALRAPGADIVGFEHVATSDEDKAAIEAALAALKKPDSVVALPEAAGCAVQTVAAELHSDGDHDHDHGHDHAKKAGHDDHDHDHGHDHAKKAGHDDHDHDHAEKAGHDDHDHDHGHDHAAEAVHSEFEAEYVFTCGAPDQLTAMTFPFFATFAGGEEIEMRLLTDKGAATYEIERDAPEVDLSGAI